MRKLLKTLGVTAMVALLLTILGCAAMMDYATPAMVDDKAVEYSGEKRVSLFPIPMLADAKRINTALGHAHEDNQLYLIRMIEDDQRVYGRLTKTMQMNIAAAVELQENLFGPSGAVSMLMGAVGLSAGALFIKRPGDLKPADVEDV